MTDWHPNKGRKPMRPGNDELAIDKVFVRLRCGMEPPAPWPVDTGRYTTTRWTLEDHPFDIIAWRPA